MGGLEHDSKSKSRCVQDVARCFKKATHMSRSDIQEQADLYDKRWTSLSKRRELQHRKNRIAAIRRILEMLPLEEPEILEIGSGLSRSAGELLKFGKVEGTDLSREAVEIAIETYPESQFYSGDLFSYDFGGRRNDLVVTTQLVKHMPVDNKGRPAGRCDRAAEMHETILKLRCALTCWHVVKAPCVHFVTGS